MSDIQKAIQSLKNSIPQEVALIAVSKTKPIEDLKDAYQGGQRIFGENRVAEMIEKSEKLPSDIEWHFIGHLQRKKVKSLLPHASLIHAVDSLKLLEEINKRAEQIEKVQPVLIQVHIAEESAKYGFSPDELESVFEKIQGNYEAVQIKGLMGMATFTDDKAKIRAEFKVLKNAFDLIKDKFYAEDDGFSEISMGMSGDYEIAIKEGSTMVRIGSSIFGKRN